MQRIVSRSELRSASVSPSVSPAPVAAQAIQDFDLFQPSPSQTAAVGARNEDDLIGDEELDFRLFTAAPAQAGEVEAAVHKIRLRSPTVNKEDAGFVQPNRSSDYYFAAPLTPAEQADIESIAVSGTHVRIRSGQPWPGSAYPWKVLHLPVSSLPRSLRHSGTAPFTKLIGDAGSKKRTRPGKKYRIRLRTKKAAVEARKQASKAAAAAKDAADQEKRTRRNREKKAKKRLRDKAKKAAVVEMAPDAPHARDPGSNDQDD